MAQFHPLNYSQYFGLFKIGYLLVDANDEVLSANKEARNFLNDFKDCLQENCFLKQILPELYTKRQNHPLLTRQQHDQSNPIRLKRQNPDGSEKYLDVFIKPSLDSSANLVIFLQDVSPLAKYEKELEEQQNELSLLKSEKDAQEKQIGHEIKQRKNAEERLQHLITNDPLTDIKSRRYFFEVLHDELARAGRYKRPISLVLFDLDDLKRVNDIYGQSACDQTLKAVVKRVQASLRQSDILARYSGEQFVILLPETNAKQATQASERLRKLVAGQSFLFENRRIAVTISLGVAGLDEATPGLTGDYLISIANKALKEAKKAGQDQVYLPI